VVIKKKCKDSSLDGSFKGFGNGYIIKNKCTKLIPFTSSYSYIYSEDNSIENTNFTKIIYKNSLIGKRILSAAFGPRYNSNSLYQELASDGLLNFINIFFFDTQLNQIFVIITITGTYKKYNYSSIDLQYRLPESPPVVLDDITKNNSSEEFHKILDANENLNKIYLQIKSILGCY
jgi:hypothetical protein